MASQEYLAWHKVKKKTTLELCTRLASPLSLSLSRSLALYPNSIRFVWFQAHVAASVWEAQVHSLQEQRRRLQRRVLELRVAAPATAVQKPASTLASGPAHAHAPAPTVPTDAAFVVPAASSLASARQVAGARFHRNQLVLHECFSADVPSAFDAASLAAPAPSFDAAAHQDALVSIVLAVVA